MRILRIHAHPIHRTLFPQKLIEAIRKGRQLGGTDEGKVEGIKEKEGIMIRGVLEEGGGGEGLGQDFAFLDDFAGEIGNFSLN